MPWSISSGNIDQKISQRLVANFHSSIHLISPYSSKSSYDRKICPLETLPGRKNPRNNSWHKIPTLVRQKKTEKTKVEDTTQTIKPNASSIY